MSNDLVKTSLDQAAKELRSGSLRVLAGPPSPQEMRRIRTTLGLSQEAFAHRLGVSVGTVQSWELGRRKPGRLTQRLIAGSLEDLS